MGNRTSQIQHIFQVDCGACIKAANCLSHLVELHQNRPTTINMLSATHSDGPAFAIGVG